MIRLVLDTNVVLDLLHFEDPAVAPLRQALQEGRAACFASAATRAELAHVLSRPQFKLDGNDIRRLLDAYDALARPCEPVAGAALPTCRDPDDQKFLELAQSAGADVLVTKDKALLALARKSARLGFRIVTPASSSELLAG